jgi:hypothetical protein
MVVAIDDTNATKGWNAVAIGASGRLEIKLGAESERDAVDDAMQSCRGQDRDCRIAIIGPFQVEGTQEIKPRSSLSP